MPTPRNVTKGGWDGNRYYNGISNLESIDNICSGWSNGNDTWYRGGILVFNKAGLNARRGFEMTDPAKTILQFCGNEWWACFAILSGVIGVAIAAALGSVFCRSCHLLRKIQKRIQNWFGTAVKAANDRVDGKAAMRSVRIMAVLIIQLVSVGVACAADSARGGEILRELANGRWRTACAAIMITFFVGVAMALLLLRSHKRDKE